jgi:hypothetical protein
LNSFILSVTPYKDLEFYNDWELQDYYDNNVFFISKNMEDFDKIENIEKLFDSIK